MVRSLLSRWLEHYDSVHRGWTPRGIANAVCSTCGFGFPRIRGGYNLYRSAGGVPEAGRVPVGAAGADAGVVRTFPWVTHAAGTTYVYRLTSLNGGGAENIEDEVLCRVAFDAAGGWVGLRPNAVSDLRVTSLSGGRFEVVFCYMREGEQAEPVRFDVYCDGGTGEVDFGSAVGSVGYQRGRLHYTYVSEAFAHDTPVRWSVKAVSAAGVASEACGVVTGRAAAQAPPADPVVFVEASEV